ncbi:hypothetical protein KIN20_017313 [Parelaphostrongylus tenuis]|uniref:Uncharacterized protein n=1 Tax=Parelaphostrongylus tenuis TaxID=148309 RepID=A0AAD5MLC0_PARTN|nr:hypothetical protein KIN20_017313 [Parelaphostrongylus tenuis]
MASMKCHSNYNHHIGLKSSIATKTLRMSRARSVIVTGGALSPLANFLRNTGFFTLGTDFLLQWILDFRNISKQTQQTTNKKRWKNEKKIPSCTIFRVGLGFIARKFDKLK